MISPLRQSHMFITAACLQELGPGRFCYVLAGHPPMLHISKADGTARWVGESQLALSIIEATVYTAANWSSSRATYS